MDRAVERVRHPTGENWKNAGELPVRRPVLRRQTQWRTGLGIALCDNACVPRVIYHRKLEVANICPKFTAPLTTKPMKTSSTVSCPCSPLFQSFCLLTLGIIALPVLAHNNSA